MKYDPSIDKTTIPLQQIEQEFFDGVDSCRDDLDPLTQGHYDRMKENKMQWDDYLYDLANFPIAVAGLYQWVPGSDDEQRVYENLLWQYRVKAQWLDYLNPGDKPFHPFLTHGSNGLVKPAAQVSKSFLDLCVTVIGYANVISNKPPNEHMGENIKLCGMFENLETLKRLIPTDLWFSMEWRGCLQYFWESGLIDGVPVSTSKRGFYDDRQNYISLFESTEVWQPRNGIVIKGPDVYIPMLASAIAKDDILFRNSSPYQNYIKNQRFYANFLRKNKAFEFIRLTDGKIVQSKKSKGVE